MADILPLSFLVEQASLPVRDYWSSELLDTGFRM